MVIRPVPHDSLRFSLHGLIRSCTTIPNSVTSIGDGAFNGCTSLTAITVDADNVTYDSVDGVLFNKSQTTLIECPEGKTGNYIIPGSVTSIKRGAFAGCTSLTAITVDADNFRYGSVGGVLFNKSQTTLIQCPGGKTGNYIVPNSVISIGGGAFFGCTNLTSVTIPSSVISIGDGAFFGCTSLTSVTIPDSVTGIESWAFDGCTSLTSVTIPNSVTYIGYSAFSDCTSLASVTIPSSVTGIGVSAFSGCTSLASATIPTSVTSIGGGAFSGCTSLTSVTILSSVISIEDRAFSRCTSLKGAYFKSNAPNSVPSVFKATPNATVYYLPGTTGWGPTFGGRPTALWNPEVQTSDGIFGVRANRFGFNISGTSDLVIVVEASTSLATPIWAPISTNTLTGGTSYFSDPQWANYPSRFYRLRSP